QRIPDFRSHPVGSDSNFLCVSFFRAAPGHGDLNTVVKCRNGNLVLGTQILHEEIETVQKERPGTAHAAAMIDKKKNAIPAGYRREIPDRLYDAVFINTKIVLTEIGDRLLTPVVNPNVHGHKRCREFQLV